MKLEKNMYVRTKLGIAKIVRLDDLDNVAWTDNKKIYFGIKRPKEKLYFEVYDDGTVLKQPSFNIIDLIEVGDYVNGKKVIILKSNIPEGLDLDANDEEDILYTDCYNGIWYGCSKEEIKNIVTHEQFEQISYKVGE